MPAIIPNFHCQARPEHAARPATAVIISRRSDPHGMPGDPLPGHITACSECAAPLEAPFPGRHWIPAPAAGSLIIALKPDEAAFYNTSPINPETAFESALCPVCQAPAAGPCLRPETPDYHRHQAVHFVDRHGDPIHLDGTVIENEVQHHHEGGRIPHYHRPGQFPVTGIEQPTERDADWSSMATPPCPRN